MTDGRAFEWKVRDFLIASGYWVIRAAGSKGAVDLVALRCKTPSPGMWTKARMPLFVQAKAHRFGLPEKEWNALVELARACGAVPILAERPERGVVRFWALLGPKEPRRQEPRTLFRPGENVAGDVVKGWAIDGDRPYRVGRNLALNRDAREAPA